MFEWVTWFVCLVRLAMLDFYYFFSFCVCVSVCVFLCVYTFLHSHSFSLNPQFVLVFICLPHSCATAYSWPSLFFFFSFCLSLYLSLCLSLSCFSAFPSASPWPAFCVPDRSFRQVFLSRIQCDYWSRFSFWTVAVAVAVARNFSASCCAVVSLPWFEAGGNPVSLSFSFSFPRLARYSCHSNLLLLLLLFGVGKNLGYIYFSQPRTIK